MPKVSPHPHVSWRDGRPRFQPGTELRAQGMKGTDLRWPQTPPDGWNITKLEPGDRNEGRWYSKGEAVDWSAAFVKKLATRKRPPRATPAKPVVARPAGKVPSLYTLERLFDEWFRSTKFQVPADPLERRRLRAARVVYADNTIADYRAKAAVLEAFDPSLWASPVDALSQPVLFGVYEELLATRGLATARGVIATLSVALSWGKRRGRFTFRENMGINPAADLGMSTPPPRVRFATRPEIEALIAVADRIGEPEIGDSIMLGLWTGQRQADRLELEDNGLMRGRRIFRQAKTGAIVAVLEAPELERRLAASAERRRPAKAEALMAASPQERQMIERRFRRVILNELVDRRAGMGNRQSWSPFERGYYSHRFARLRSYAVAGILDVAATAGAGRAVWIVKPCPSLEDFNDADLRDTAVTWMALAGATIPEIISVTGHTAASANTILKHYLAQHPEMADAAIGKMMAWFDAGGETEIGL